MKRLLVIHVSGRDVDRATFESLCRLVPGDYYGVFHVKLPDDSPECVELLRTLEAAGYRPRERGEESAPGMFSLRPNYEYEPADLDRADYFRMTPDKSVDVNYGRSPQGILNLHPSRLARKGPLLSAIPDIKVVSSSFRRELEEAGFVGLAFRPTRVMRGDSYEELEEVPWSKVGCDPFWELTASVQLPRLSPRCRLVNDKGDPIVDDNWSKGVFLIEDEYPAGELHYRRSDLRDIPSFDFALTHEPFGYSRSEYGKKLILSRRVYDFVKARRLKCLWLPVYVDGE